jgi:hypothetical protein
VKQALGVRAGGCGLMLPGEERACRDRCFWVYVYCAVVLVVHATGRQVADTIQQVLLGCPPATHPTPPPQPPAACSRPHRHPHSPPAFAVDPVRSETKVTFVRQLWRERLRGVQRHVEVWQSLFSVRSLVVPAHEDVDNWLRFAALCRKSGRVRQSQRMLLQLLRWAAVAVAVAVAVVVLVVVLV